MGLLKFTDLLPDVDEVLAVINIVVSLFLLDDEDEFTFIGFVNGVHVVEVIDDLGKLTVHQEVGDLCDAGMGVRDNGDQEIEHDNLHEHSRKEEENPLD